MSNKDIISLEEAMKKRITQFQSEPLFSHEVLMEFQEDTQFIIISENPLVIGNDEDESVATGKCAEIIIDNYFNVR